VLPVDNRAADSIRVVAEVHPKSATTAIVQLIKSMKVQKIHFLII
jgi:hypothetical protein